ncbi:UNVERIFIED_CONTAM: N-carbamoylputrescine amidase [Brevibacillus sp. OAP136]
MRKVTVAATQMSCSANQEENILKAEKLVREAAGKGANVILLQELFENLYFCQSYDNRNFELAHEAKDHPTLSRMSELAKELGVVLPISFFEKSNNVFFNSVMVIDADGTQLGVYRKTHIPDDPGYFEKFYFSPGNTGFKVWQTKFGKIGIGICWDQWFPETARSMALQGAEMIFYPTAIGKHTNGLTDDCSDHWQLTMRGHAAANMVPVIASNRIGLEEGQWTKIEFFGRSFITGCRGELIQEAGDREETILTAEFDLDEIEKTRRHFVLFRDRRPECYQTLLTLDGKK